MSILFISDLHLDAQDPDAGEQFLDFLSARAARAQALYILGDLFEVWVGDDDDDPYRARICAAIGALGAAGVPCYVMHGNRDFLLQQGFEQRSGTHLLPDPVIIELGGEAVLLTHGDALCTADRPYQQLRATVRDRTWQRRFLRLPLSVRRLLADQARAGSRRHTGRTAYRIMDTDPEAVAAAMRACAVRVLIHGHTHRPAVHQFLLDGQQARRIVLGPWHEQGSTLCWEDGEFRLEELPRRGRPSESAVPDPGC